MELGTVVKTFTSKKGNTVVIRYPKEDDFHAIWGFACGLADEDTFVGLNKAPTEAEETVWFREQQEKIRKDEVIHLEVFVNGSYAGNGRVERGKYRRSHVGNIGIALAPPFRSEGIGTELMQALIGEAKRLTLRLLVLSCFENNAPALHLYEKLGFVRSGTTPGAIAFKGEYTGEVHYYLPLT